MAEEDDDSFGDFSFAYYPSKPTIDFQINAQKHSDLEDDEWNDFVEYPRGSDSPNRSSQQDGFDQLALFPTHEFQNPATCQMKSPETAHWVKPRGALPLSLFGEEEDDEKHEMGGESAHMEAQFAAGETNLLSSVSNPGSSIGLNDILASLPNQTSKLQPGRPSSNPSNSGNQNFSLDLSKLDFNWGSTAGNKDPCQVHNMDLNLIRTESISKAVEQPSSECIRDFSNFSWEQTGSRSNLSVDVIDLGEQIKNEGAVDGVNRSTFSSDTTASSYSGWGLDFGGFGSSSKTWNSSFSGLNSNLDATGACEKSDAKNTDGDCDNDDVWEFKDAFTDERDVGANNKAGSEAHETYETITHVVGFCNGLNKPLDFFPMSNGLAEEADSLTQHIGDVNAYSGGILQTDIMGHDNIVAYMPGNLSNRSIFQAEEADSLTQYIGEVNAYSGGTLQTDIKGHDTGNIVAYMPGNLSNQSIDLFSMPNRTDSAVQDVGDTHAFPSWFSNGSVMTNESIKTMPEAHETGSLKDNLSSYSGSASPSAGLFTALHGSVDLFTSANPITSIMHESKVESNDKLSACTQNDFIADSNGSSGKRDSNGDDFGEFTSALSDSGSKREVNMSGSIYEGALPLSVFGNEELDFDVSSTINDGFMCHQIPFQKSDKKLNPGISINDVIPSLHDQAEHTSSASSLKNLSDVVEPPYSGDISNLVNDEDAIADVSWEPKDSIFQRRADNETSSLDHGEPLPSSLSIRKLDHYLEFYSKLKEELCLHCKYKLPDLKGGADNKLEYESSKCEGDYITAHPSWETCFHEFLEALKKPKFHMLESEYNISKRLSQMEKDFCSSDELINHASIMLNLLTLVSVEGQHFYASTWDTMISVCTRELQHGTWLWKQILNKDAQSQILSNKRGRTYILGLSEIYKVAVVLEASIKLYQPWTWLNSVDFTGIHSLLDECHALWSSSGLEQAIMSISDLEPASTIRWCLHNIKSILDIDALTLQKRLFCRNGVTCRLSLLTSEVLHELGMKLVIWNEEHYILSLANFWANLVSNDPPEWPHLCFAR
ncbi:hypothetical protein DM860_007785 [Cuscuta australis]|uniref:Synergin gamma C-terminal domain-containing protein n=1 Tax=Cuscuta australis TaxID=267555 RepID=A0A328E0Y4_9ASTE|nr:hypothetical protein DM860_007785 [Cuscuta australis]